jgi:hypothetical protein
MVANMARNLASIVSLAGSLADIVRSLASLAGKQTWFAKCSNYYYYYATQNDNKSIQTVDDTQIKSINSIKFMTPF